uniref:Uncharacterized protein n=1 Tax=Anguilla anguilla TaxID=7936 RepID=A0A0E9W066_ANGAN
MSRIILAESAPWLNFQVLFTKSTWDSSRQDSL